MKNFLITITNRDEWINNGKFINYHQVGFFKKRDELDAIVDPNKEYSEMTFDMLHNLIKTSEEKGDDAFCSWLVAIYNMSGYDNIILISCDK